MTPLEIRPMEGAGAEILGADITNLSVGDWNQIEAAFAAFGAIVFRDQLVTASEHVEFAGRWGTVVPPAGNMAHADFREIEVIEGSHAASPTWRSEGSFKQSPSLGSVVVPRSLPDLDVDTLWCATADAFDALSGSTQRELEGLTAVHTPTSSARRPPKPGGAAPQVEHHPVVIRHPVSGRKTLFINPTFTSGIVGMSEIDGLALLNQLYEHCQREEFIGRLQWEIGSVALWDERAMWSFGGSEHRVGTVMHRVEIAGTTLSAAAQTETRDPSLTQRAGATLAGGVITAAMTGIAEVIDPERVRPQIEIVSEAPEQEPLTPLDFGGLPPLD